MRVVFMGTPVFSVPALRAIHEAGHDILQVYTRPPIASGRGMKQTPSPVQSTADELGLEVQTPKNFKSPETVETFAALDCDLAVVVAYGLILPQVILAAPRLGCWNIHASLLPRWRGAAPVQRAIMAGDTKTGIAIMQMEAGLDTGPVLETLETPITASDTSESLHARLADLGATGITEAMARAGELTPVPQPDDGVCYADKIDKAEARIDWTRPAHEVDCHIRGLSPFPALGLRWTARASKCLAQRLLMCKVPPVRS